VVGTILLYKEAFVKFEMWNPRDQQQFKIRILPIYMFIDKTLKYRLQKEISFLHCRALTYKIRRINFVRIKFWCALHSESDWFDACRLFEGPLSAAVALIGSDGSSTSSSSRGRCSSSSIVG
jgi:hypothetical protein